MTLRTGSSLLQGVVEIVEDDAPGSSGKDTNQSGENQSGSQNSGSEKKYKIVYEGLAAFKDDRLVGYLNGVEARAYNFLTNNIQTTYISVPSGESFTGLEIKNAKSDIQTSMENDQVIVDISVNVTTGVIAEGDGIDVTQPDQLKIIEQRFNQQLLEEIAAMVIKVQQDLKSDIIGFGEYVHIQHPDEWRRIRDNWSSYFENAVIKITIDSKINHTGEIKEPYKMEELE